ncbi:hypothetical protein PsorP6_001916 [Peronosclerospora sorghi]|uniref:Uncharacterized protein n=1 Tax=Peronosclerospora sorghi TaxID=230839 RepID=A0ACC0WRJ5_9STRA|nr:hypothetical protein PsorP6_001916 [Peronosclerospora sorghi]
MANHHMFHNVHCSRNGILGADSVHIDSPNHDNTIVVHAGLVSEVKLRDQQPYDMYKMRFVQRKKRRMGILNGLH